MTDSSGKDGLTKAQEEVNRVLARLLEKGRPYRVGALLLAYRDVDGQTRVAGGIGLQTGAVMTDAAAELVELIDRLGTMQSEINDVIEGRASLPTAGLTVQRPSRWASPSAKRRKP